MRSHLSIGPQQQANHRLASPIYVMPRKRSKGRRAESIQLRGRLLSHITVHNAVQERTAQALRHDYGFSAKTCRGR